MNQNRIPKWALAAVAVLLLVGLGSAIHNAGWSQGFAMGLLAGNADGNTLAPYLAYRTGYGWHPGGFFGGFFRFAFFLFVFAMIARLNRVRPTNNSMVYKSFTLPQMQTQPR